MILGSLKDRSNWITFIRRNLLNHTLRHLPLPILADNIVDRVEHDSLTLNYLSVYIA